MEKYTVNTPNTEVMGYDDFQDFIKELFFDEVTEFSLQKEVKVFEGSAILDYTVTFSNGRVVRSAFVIA